MFCPHIPKLDSSAPCFIQSRTLVTRIGAMEIERTTFGTITIDGKTYEHDVIIRLSGDVVKRKKNFIILLGR